MTGSADNSGGSTGTLSPEQTAEFKRRLSDLDQRLDRTIEEHKEEESRPSVHSNVGRYGFRMVADFIAAIIVGGLIGYGLDFVFGTKPVMLLIFILLGFAAGIASLMRTYKRMQNEIAIQTGGNVGQDLPDSDDD